jgi:hypothetical protein
MKVDLVLVFPSNWIFPVTENKLLTVSVSKTIFSSQRLTIQVTLIYSSMLKKQQATNRILFQSYCDRFWDLEMHVDERSSFFQYWLCQGDQYQCQTGQCVELD